MPYCLVQTLLYAFITYSMMSLQWTGLKFFYYTFVLFFTLLYFTFYGMMAVAITPNYQVATILAAGFYSIFNLFSGFMIFKPVSTCASHSLLAISHSINVSGLSLVGMNDGGYTKLEN